MPTGQTTPQSFRRTSCPSATVDFALLNIIYLQNARGQIDGPIDLSKHTRRELDSGIEISFISTSIIDALKLDVAD